MAGEYNSKIKGVSSDSALYTPRFLVAAAQWGDDLERLYWWSEVTQSPDPPNQMWDPAAKERFTIRVATTYEWKVFFLVDLSNASAVPAGDRLYFKLVRTIDGANPLELEKSVVAGGNNPNAWSVEFTHREQFRANARIEFAIKLKADQLKAGHERVINFRGDPANSSPGGISYVHLFNV